jgi:hypothetical protein
VEFYFLGNPETMSSVFFWQEISPKCKKSKNLPLGMLANDTTRKDQKKNP